MAHRSSEVSESRVDILLSWCKQNGIQIHPNLRIVSIENDQSSSYGHSSSIAAPSNPISLVDYSDSESEDALQSVLLDETAHPSNPMTTGDFRRGNSVQRPNSNDVIAGISVLSHGDIEQGTIVVQIPPGAVLSYRNARVIDDDEDSAAYGENIGRGFLGEHQFFSAGAQFNESGARLAERDDEYADANLAMTLALLSELAKRRGSRWWGYLQSLPYGDLPLAIFWPEEFDMDEDGHDEAVLLDWKAARARVHDTQLDHYLRSTRDKQLLMRQYHTSVVERVIPECTWREFCRAYALVSSRAFWVDAFHGLALVPVADAFNHSENNHVHLETDWSVCPVCGSLDICEHDEEESRERKHTQEEFISHTYDMVCDRDIEAQEEVFNTYDARGLSNVHLLCQYGFLIEGNSKDTVHFVEEEIEHASKALVLQNHSPHEEWTLGDNPKFQGLPFSSHCGSSVNLPPTSPSSLLNSQRLNTLTPEIHDNNSHLTSLSTSTATSRGEDGVEAREDLKTQFASKVSSTGGVGTSLDPSIRDAWSANELHVLVRDMMKSSGLVSFGHGQRNPLEDVSGDEIWEEIDPSTSGDPWVPDNIQISIDVNGLEMEEGPSPTGKRLRRREAHSRQNLPINHVNKSKMPRVTATKKVEMGIDADGLASEALWTRLVGESIRLLSVMTVKTYSGNGPSGRASTVAESAGPGSRATAIGLIRSGSTVSNSNGKHRLYQLGRDLEKSGAAIIIDEADGGVQQRVPERGQAMSIQNQSDKVKQQDCKTSGVDERWIEERAGYGQGGSMKEDVKPKMLNSYDWGRTTVAHVDMNAETKPRSIDELLESINKEEEKGLRRYDVGTLSAEEEEDYYSDWNGETQARKKRRLNEEVLLHRMWASSASLVDTGRKTVREANRAKMVVWTTCKLMEQIVKNRLDVMDDCLEDGKMGPVEEMAVRYVRGEKAMLKACSSNWEDYRMDIFGE